MSSEIFFLYLYFTFLVALLVLQFNILFAHIVKVFFFFINCISLTVNQTQIISVKERKTVTEFKYFVRGNLNKHDLMVFFSHIFFQMVGVDTVLLSYSTGMHIGT